MDASVKPKTPFDTFMDEKVMPQKPYLDKFMPLKNQKNVHFRDMQDDYFNLLNKRNKDVILRKSNFTTIHKRDAETGALLQKAGEKCLVVFSMNEPDPIRFVPIVSPLKLGTLLAVNTENSDVFLEIQLREDFVSSDDEEMLLEAVASYKGQGLYHILLSEIVQLMIMLPSDSEKLKAALSTEPAILSKVSSELYETNQKENLTTAALKQFEFYFGDKNYGRDAFLKQQASKDAERWIPV